jgi:RNase adaptor protein for sRNA GlmZ degradation
MSKQIYQFGFKNVDENKLRGEAVLDCRIIKNPFVRGIPDAVLIEKVRTNPLFEQVVKQGVQMLKTNDSIFVGCLFGKHRSGAVAQEIAARTGAIILRM